MRETNFHGADFSLSVMLAFKKFHIWGHPGFQIRDAQSVDTDSEHILPPTHTHNLGHPSPSCGNPKCPQTCLQGSKSTQLRAFAAHKGRREEKMGGAGCWPPFWEGESLSYYFTQFSVPTEGEPCECMRLVHCLFRQTPSSSPRSIPDLVVVLNR